MKRNEIKGLRAEFTVEAAVVFAVLLLLLTGVMAGTVRLWQEIRAEAERAYRAETARVQEEISPVDLVEIGLLLREWLPPSEGEGKK